jgi:hypothetical protein
MSTGEGDSRFESGVSGPGGYPASVSGARIAIEGTDPIRLRAASSLLADHRVERVGLIGRDAPAAWGDRVVAISSATGWDVGVGIPAGPERPDITPGPGGAVSWAGPTGLARALGVRLGGSPSLAGTVPGEPRSSGARFAFPEPLGWLHGDLIDGIHHCPTSGSVAGVLATNPDGASLAVIDSRDFLDAAALAAGVLLALTGHRGPVWESGETYLELVTEQGLVIADRH